MSRYIGARYVPILAGDWDNTNEYEPLTIVQYQGDSYTSKMYVPTGVAITNTQYWIKTGNFNQQLAHMAEEWVEFQDHLTDEFDDFKNDTITEVNKGVKYPNYAGTTINTTWSGAQTQEITITNDCYVIVSIYIGSNPPSEYRYGCTIQVKTGVDGQGHDVFVDVFKGQINDTRTYHAGNFPVKAGTTIKVLPNIPTDITSVTTVETLVREYPLVV